MYRKTFFLLLCIAVVISLYFFNTGIHTQNHSLERNGFKLHLVSYENPQSTIVTPYRDVLLIHGLTYSSMQFDLNIRQYSLARFLANQGFRVWLLDITGYGQSDKPNNGFIVNTQYAVEDINTAVDYILQAEKSNKINILGWSWGTITTSQFASTHSDKVNKLVLLAPIIHGLNLPAPKTHYQAFSIEAAKSDFDPRKVESDIIDAYLRQTQRYDGAGSPNGSRKDLYQPHNIQLIPYQHLKTPTLFIAGDADPYLCAKKDLTELMQYAPAGSCKILVHGGGHAIFLEKSYYRDFQNNVSNFFINGCPGSVSS